MDDKERFISLCSCIKREGISDLLSWLDKSDFYIAPSSSRFHGAYPGGLLRHSINVYDELHKLLKVYQEIECSEETATIISLFHDLCKVNFYTTEKRNRKNSEGVWESYDAYKIEERYKFGGHGSKSVYLIQYFMKLSPTEAAAINCHMGAWENPHFGDVYKTNPLAWLLSVADQSATYMLEKE